MAHLRLIWVPFGDLYLTKPIQNHATMGINNTKEPTNSVVVVYMTYMDHIWTVVMVLVCTRDFSIFSWISTCFKLCLDTEPPETPQRLSKYPPERWQKNQSLG